MPRQSLDPRVKAIREDPTIGLDSLTDIDETWTDKELIDYLDSREIRSPREAVAEMRDVSAVVMEQMDADTYYSRTKPKDVDYYGFPTG